MMFESAVDMVSIGGICSFIVLIRCQYYVVSVLVHFNDAARIELCAKSALRHFEAQFYNKFEVYLTFDFFVS